MYVQKNIHTQDDLDKKALSCLPDEGRQWKFCIISRQKKGINIYFTNIRYLMVVDKVLLWVGRGSCDSGLLDDPGEHVGLVELAGLHHLAAQAVHSVQLLEEI